MRNDKGRSVHLDYIFKDPLVLDVDTGRAARRDVGVAGGRIAWVGEGEPLPGPDTEIIEAGDSYLTPGFFDAHAHSDLFFNPAAFADAFVVRGVTGVFSDNHDCASALGPGGYEGLLDAARSFNIRFYAGVPAAAPGFMGVEGPELFPFDDFKRLMDRDDVLSISEIIAWPVIVRSERRILERLEYSRRIGKRAEGHTVGADPEKLRLLAGAGITSCHEPLSPKDVRDRLDAGLTVMVRESSIRTDLDEIIPYVCGLSREEQDRICLVTDGVFAQDYMRRGALDYTVARAVDRGLAPEIAFRMATLNPARYFGLDHLIGRVRPGLAADLILVRDLSHPDPHRVMLGGRLVAVDGRLAVPPSPMPDIGLGDRPFRFDGFGPETFDIHTGSTNGRAVFPVVEVLDPTVTGKGEIDLPVDRGLAAVPLDGDLMRAAMIARDGDLIGLGLVRGLGFTVDGLACSVAHDTHGLLVIGTCPDDMSAAVGEVVRMGGGIVAVEEGRVLVRAPLPIGGIMSGGSMAETATLMSEVTDLLTLRGAPWPDPLLPVIFLSFTGILNYRITYGGVYDVRQGRIVFNGTGNNNVS